jgi:hypothetical protein
MATRTGWLTALDVKRRTRRGYYHDGAGLYLQVDANGNKSWIFRYGAQGKHHHYGLGPVHTVTLAEARVKARQCRQLLLEGRDPIAEKRARIASARLEAAKAASLRIVPIAIESRARRKSAKI